MVIGGIESTIDRHSRTLQALETGDIVATTIAGSPNERIAEAERRAHEAMAHASFAEMARFLQELVGQRTAALMVDIKNPKAVGQWARKEREPQGATQQHLRDAYQVAMLLREVAPAQVVQNWLLGMNPYLDDEAPALHIVDQPREVLRAARAFVAVG